MSFIQSLIIFYAGCARNTNHFLGSVDLCHVNLTKFLNGSEERIYAQTFLWSFVAYFSINFCDFIDQDLKLTLINACVPVYYLIPLAFIIFLSKTPGSQTIVELFGNHELIYTFLICLVEATIVWAITVLKSKVTNESTMTLVVLSVAVYYTMVTVFELLRLKDRGSVSGVATVILFLAGKRIGWWSIPFTAAIVFGKYMLCSDCCTTCRRQKKLMDEEKQNRREEFKYYLEGLIFCFMMSTIPDKVSESSEVSDSSEVFFDVSDEISETSEVFVDVPDEISETSEVFVDVPHEMSESSEVFVDVPDEVSESSEVFVEVSDEVFLEVSDEVLHY